MPLEELGDDAKRALDGARYVKFSHDEPLCYIWLGGHGIHVHNTFTWKEVDFFNIGNFANENEPLLAEVQKSVWERVNHIEE